MMVEGIDVRTTNQNGQGVQDIGKLWQCFFTTGEYDKIENKKNEKAIGLYTNYESDATKPYDFIAGVEVKEKSQELGQRKIILIPKGKYAKFVVVGDKQQAVGKAWYEIWNMDLKRKYTCDFEEYQNNTQEEQNQEIHIYIAVEE